MQVIKMTNSVLEGWDLMSGCDRDFLFGITYRLTLGSTQNPPSYLHLQPDSQSFIDTTCILQFLKLLATDHCNVINISPVVCEVVIPWLM